MHPNQKRVPKICMIWMEAVHTRLKRLFLGNYGRLFILMKTMEGLMQMPRNKWKIFLEWIQSKYQGVVESGSYCNSTDWTGPFWQCPVVVTLTNKTEKPFSPTLPDNIPKYSRMFWNIPKYSRIFQNIQEYFKIIRNIAKYLGIFQNIQKNSKYSRIFQNISKCSKISENIPLYSKIFHHIPKYSKIFQIIPKH